MKKNQKKGLNFITRCANIYLRDLEKRFRFSQKRAMLILYVPPISHEMRNPGRGRHLEEMAS